MRVVLSTIGSRGDVEPLVALATELRSQGHEARMCVPPDFREWLAGLGLRVFPVGPEVRGIATGATPLKPSPEQRQRVVESMVADQFATVGEAAQGCDVIVGFGAMQVAAHSVAESLGIQYIYANYSPNMLPSAHHAPAPPPGWEQDETVDNLELWAQDARRWHDFWGASLNAHRAAAGLTPLHNGRRHMFTDRPWLAADPTLAPWPESGEDNVIQTGAWILPDKRPLSAELEAFLDAGEPPVYFGLGSTPLPGEELGRVFVETARALGRRAIVSRGWADLDLPEGPDVIEIREANLQALFRRTATAVHHGGSGTTTIAAQAATAQIIIPQHYDQNYWARRVEDLGIGTAHEAGMPTADTLAAALDRALEPDVTVRTKAVAAEIRDDGVRTAVHRLTGTSYPAP